MPRTPNDSERKLLGLINHLTESEIRLTEQWYAAQKSFIENEYRRRDTVAQANNQRSVDFDSYVISAGKKRWTNDQRSKDIIDLSGWYRDRIQTFTGVLQLAEVFGDLSQYGKVKGDGSVVG